MAAPGLTRQTRHYLISDKNSSSHVVIPLTLYIGGHETQMTTQPSEITVEQETTIESYAEGIETRHSVRPMYAGDGPDKMVAVEDDHDNNWLLTVYDNGAFYFGKCSVSTGADYPTTGFVTQNTDFPQIAPWVAHYQGATRIMKALNANADEDLNKPLKQYDRSPNKAYVVVTNDTGLVTNTAAVIEKSAGSAITNAATNIQARHHRTPSQRRREVGDRHNRELQQDRTQHGRDVRSDRN